MIKKILITDVNVHDVCWSPKNIDSKGIQILSIYGDVSCGNFKLIEDCIEGYLEIPQSMLGGAEYFVMKAKGQSMIEAGINDGDLLIIQKKPSPNDGEIAVVLRDEKVVLKRFYRLRKEEKYRLRPENEQYQDKIVDSCEVLGVAVKVIKDI